MTTLVDTHCHLDAEQFSDETVPALLDRAAAAGIRRVVNIGIDLATSRASVALAEAHPPIYAAVGVDPNDAAGFTDADLEALRALAASPKVVAVGEIGLDYHWNRAPHEVQARVFSAQLELARDLGLPVVIHNRDADEDTAAILLDWAAAARAAGAYPDRPVGVMHCYSGDLPLAERLVAAGFLISLAGVVSYKNAARTQAVALGLPESALVLETDAPYLSPIPHRGRRNEPAHLRATAEFVARLRQTTLEALAGATSANAARLFGWAAPETWTS
jgi:TatD DNase family protein